MATDKITKKLYDKLRPIPLEQNPVAASIVKVLQQYDKFAVNLEKEAKKILLGEGTFTESELRILLALTDDSVDKLNIIAERWSQIAVTESYVSGQDLVEIFADYVEDEGHTLLAPRDQEKFNSFIDEMSTKVYREVKMVNDEMRDRLDNIIYKGMKERRSINLTKRPGIRGGVTTQNQIGTRLYREIIDEGIKLVDSAGRMWTPDRYVRMYARTRTREIQTQGIEDKLQENNLDLVRISKHTDVDGFDICNEYEDNIYSLSGNSDKYPMLDVHTPFHPNCGHVETPYIAEIEEFIKARKEGKTIKESGEIAQKVS